MMPGWSAGWPGHPSEDATPKHDGKFQQDGRCIADAETTRAMLVLPADVGVLVTVRKPLADARTIRQELGQTLACETIPHLFGHHGRQSPYRVRSTSNAGI